MKWHNYLKRQLICPSCLQHQSIIWKREELLCRASVIKNPTNLHILKGTGVCSICVPPPWLAPLRCGRSSAVAKSRDAKFEANKEQFYHCSTTSSQCTISRGMILCIHFNYQRCGEHYVLQIPKGLWIWPSWWRASRPSKWMNETNHQGEQRTKYQMNTWPRFNLYLYSIFHYNQTWQQF